MSDYISKSAVIEALEKVKSEIQTPADTVWNNAVKVCIDNVIEAPTLSETEIIRKYGEQILNEFYGKHAEYRRLSEQANMELPQECYYNGHTKGFEEAIKIVREECGIE